MTRTSTAYNLVADALRTEILSGGFVPRQQLPTEQELCERFATSRITIRRALQILDEELLVQRRQGSGTYVSPAPSRKIPLLNAAFFNSVSRHAPDMHRQLLRSRWEPIDVERAAILETIRGDRVLYARRIDLLANKPVAMDDLYLLKRFADCLESAELSDLDFLAAWQTAQGIRLTYCKQVLEAVCADEAVAQTLRLKKGTAVLKETDVMYLEGGRPAGLFITHYRADYFQFSGTVSLVSEAPAEIPGKMR